MRIPKFGALLPPNKRDLFERISPPPSPRFAVMQLTDGQARAVTDSEVLAVIERYSTPIAGAPHSRTTTLDTQ